MNLLYAIFIVAILTSCQNNSFNEIDSTITKVELDSIMVLDQKYRQELNSVFSEFGYDSKEFQSLLKKQNSIDSTNLIYVENLIKKYGKYPGKTLVGQTTGEVAFFVLQHAHDSIQAKYFNLIMEASRNNELKKNSVALFHDRYLINQGKPQIYGSQIGTKEIVDSLTGASKQINYLFPIKDTTKIDSLRMWNGLLPLEDHLNSFGLTRWTKETSDNEH